jgi:hypothetical protein
MYPYIEDILISSILIARFHCTTSPLVHLHEYRHRHESRFSTHIAFRIAMEDAVRPDEQAFKAMYEKGYCTWLSLYESTTAERKTHLPWWDSMFRLDHPTFPKDLAVDASFSNTALAKGTSTWKTSQGSCDLPSFDQEFFIPIASDSPVTLDISEQ